jgi:hypothetical protein
MASGSSTVNKGEVEQEIRKSQKTHSESVYCEGNYGFPDRLYEIFELETTGASNNKSPSGFLEDS